VGDLWERVLFLVGFYAKKFIVTKLQSNILTCQKIILQNQNHAAMNNTSEKILSSSKCEMKKGADG